MICSPLRCGVPRAPERAAARPFSYLVVPELLPLPIGPDCELDPVEPAPAPVLAVPRTMPFWQALWNSVLERRPSLFVSADLKSLT